MTNTNQQEQLYRWRKLMVDGKLDAPMMLENYHWKYDINNAPLTPEKVNRAIRKNYHSELQNISWLEPYTPPVGDGNLFKLKKWVDDHYPNFNKADIESKIDELIGEDGKLGGEVKTDKIKLKLEYKVIHIDGSDEYGKRQSYSKEAELLNDMGNEGWELVSVTASSINYNVYYYFKQSKT